MVSEPTKIVGSLLRNTRWSILGYWGRKVITVVLELVIGVKKDASHNHKAGSRYLFERRGGGGGGRKQLL